MVGGARPTRLRHKDFDFLKSHKFAGTQPPSFPAEFLCDAGLTMPDQNADGQPYGCTNYAQAELANDLTGVLHNPLDLEAITHANTLGGIDIRVSLDAARGLGWFKYYYNIRALGLIDWFDAFRLAQVSSLPEKRSITWGTPWFPSWEAAINGEIIDRQPNGSYTLRAGGQKQIIMPMPTQEELAAIRKNPNAFAWHDSKLDGFTTWDGVLIYRDKSWQGPTIGKGGYVGFTRDVINTVMSIKGTVAYTPTNITNSNVLRVDTTAVEWVVSLFLTLYEKLYRVAR